MERDLLLSLGSNIEPCKDYLKKAVNLLNKKFKLKSLSSLYLTEPQDDKNQNYFYNLAALYNTGYKDPFKILKIIKKIESKIGRKKDINRPKGPRIIDIDIIFFQDIIINTDSLIIPHKRLFFRKFVLLPIIELLPKDSIYLKKYELNKRLKKINNQKIIKLGELGIE